MFPLQLLRRFCVLHFRALAECSQLIAGCHISIYLPYTTFMGDEFPRILCDPIPPASVTFTLPLWIVFPVEPWTKPCFGLHVPIAVKLVSREVCEILNHSGWLYTVVPTWVYNVCNAGQRRTNAFRPTRWFAINRKHIPYYFAPDRAPEGWKASSIA